MRRCFWSRKQKHQPRYRGTHVWGRSDTPDRRGTQTWKCSKCGSEIRLPYDVHRIELDHMKIAKIRPDCDVEMLKQVMES